MRVVIEQDTSSLTKLCKAFAKHDKDAMVKYTVTTSCDVNFHFKSAADALVWMYRPASEIVSDVDTTLRCTDWSTHTECFDTIYEARSFVNTQFCKGYGAGENGIEIELNVVSIDVEKYDPIQDDWFILDTIDIIPSMGDIRENLKKLYDKERKQEALRIIVEYLKQEGFDTSITDTSNIGVYYSTVYNEEDGEEYDVSIEVDLDSPQIKYYYGGELLTTVTYDDMDDIIRYGLQSSWDDWYCDLLDCLEKKGIRAN